MPKPKVDALDIAETGIDTSLEVLLQIFDELTAGVTKQLEAETDEQHAEAKAATTQALGSVLTGDLETVKKRRDQMVELLGAIEERELRIRKTVQKAEVLARRYKNFVLNLSSSIETYMVEGNISVIEGYLHRFKLANKPDQLEITDEAAIPAEYYRMGVKDELVGALQMARAILVKIQPSATIVVIDAAIERALSEGSDRQLDKARLIEALNNKVEVPGAYILRGRKRLDIK